LAESGLHGCDYLGEVDVADEAVLKGEAQFVIADDLDSDGGTSLSMTVILAKRSDWVQGLTVASAVLLLLTATPAAGVDGAFEVVDVLERDAQDLLDDGSTCELASPLTEGEGPHDRLAVGVGHRQAAPARQPAGAGAAGQGLPQRLSEINSTRGRRS
jgi:hypothetical protein